jgi:hypothetical protein
MEDQFVNTPSTSIRFLLSIVGSLLIIGCQGTGHTVNFEPRALISSSSKVAMAQGDNLTILVEPFQDARPQQHRLGSRTHFWGGVTHFNAWNGHISDGMADLAVKYLQQRQWQASRITPDSPKENSTSDVTLTGTVLSLNANAKSGFGFTDIKVDMRVRFEVKNAIDGSTIRMVLGANGSDTVATFAPKDVERLLNLVAKDLYQQLFQDLGVRNKAFHLKPGARP